MVHRLVDIQTNGEVDLKKTDLKTDREGSFFLGTFIDKATNKMWMDVNE